MSKKDKFFNLVLYIPKPELARQESSERIKAIGEGLGHSASGTFGTSGDMAYLVMIKVEPVYLSGHLGTFMNLLDENLPGVTSFKFEMRTRSTHLVLENPSIEELRLGSTIDETTINQITTTSRWSLGVTFSELEKHHRITYEDFPWEAVKIDPDFFKGEFRKVS
ncbi:MAG: hypothetical protein AAF433_14035 [Bacteroidota bacterium]